MSEFGTYQATNFKNMNANLEDHLCLLAMLIIFYIS
jgi:hypothetical protein